jgi:hypothetical protein
MTGQCLHPVHFMQHDGLLARSRVFMAWAMCSILKNNFQHPFLKSDVFSSDIFSFYDFYPVSDFSFYGTK